MKNMKRIGWVPVVNNSRAVDGPWVKWFRESKREVENDMRANAAGFSFKTIPCYIDPKDLRAKKDGGKP